MEERERRQSSSASGLRKLARVKKLLTPPEPVRSALMPPRTGKEWRSFFLVHLPILQWVWHYQWRYLLPDFISGVTVSVMRIPQGLAYALLAELPPVIGLYTNFVPVIFYSILCTSRHLSVGTFAVVSLMVGNAISKVMEMEGLAPICLESDEAELFVNGSGRYGVCEEAGAGSSLCEASNFTCGDLKLNVAVTLSFMTGCIMLLMGLLQLGFFTIFLSESLVSGYTTGAATHVFTSQVKHIFGIELTAGPGVLQLPKVWIEVFEKIFQWPREVNTATFVVSLIAITILVLVHLLNILLSKPIPCAVANCKTKKCRIVKKIRWPIPIPGPLVVVILGTAVSYSANLDTAYNVTVVGTIPSGPPSISYPVFYFAPYLIVDAITISIVTFAVSISVAKLFSRQLNYEVDSNQELVAFGVSNVVGSFFSSFSISGGLARSLVQVKTGGKTQLVSLISSAVILVVILALGFLFEPLPRAVLASIIWVALYGMFKKVKDVYKYFKTSISDMLIWLVVFLSTVLLGVDLGLGVGVTFSLMVVIVRTVLPHSSIFIREDWKHKRSFIQNFEEPGSGVLLYRFHAPLCFLNVAVFRKNMEILTEVEHFEKDKEEPGCLQVLWLKLFHRYKRCRAKDGNTSRGSNFRVPSAANTSSLFRTMSFQAAVNVDIVEDIEDISSTPTQLRVKKDLHTIIVDCAPFGFLDIAGVKALEQAVVDFNTCGIQVLLAAMREGNRDMLERAGFYETCGKEWLFPSIQDAVQHAKHETRLVPMLNDSTASVEDEVALANTNHVQSTESSSVSVINLE